MNWRTIKQASVFVQLSVGIITLAGIAVTAVKGWTVPAMPAWVACAIVAVLFTAGLVIGHIAQRRASRTASAAESAIAADSVKFGDTIKLLHEPTGKALHSHNLACSHQGSSGQQQVTCYGGADTNDYWLVKPPHGHNDFDKRGAPIENGSVVRLEHRNTRRNLHSHPGCPSPVTGQQEVTAFGADGLGDTNDNWRVMPVGNRWTASQPLRVIHCNTGVALHSSPSREHQTYTAGQQEVSGFANRDENDVWIAVIVQR